MSKQQMIEEIRRMNRSAPEQFLIHFDEAALETYLRRLSLARAGRGKLSRWVRTGDCPAAVTRSH